MRVLVRCALTVVSGHVGSSIRTPAREVCNAPWAVRRCCASQPPGC